MVLALVGTALCLALPALAAPADDVSQWSCSPPLTNDSLKKTTRVEIKGRLWRIVAQLVRPLLERQPHRPVPPLVDWQISAGDKTYSVDFASNRELEQLAEKLGNQTVILTGTREGDTVHVTELKAAHDDYVKETVEVEVHGRLQSADVPREFPPYTNWTITVNGSLYGLDFSAAPGLEKLARVLDGTTVRISGTLQGNTVVVKDLKALDA
jgi:hypothetical protein